MCQAAPLATVTLEPDVIVIGPADIPFDPAGTVSATLPEIWFLFVRITDSSPVPPPSRAGPPAEIVW
jgi:hypothetical protein